MDNLSQQFRSLAETLTKELGAISSKLELLLQQTKQQVEAINKARDAYQDGPKSEIKVRAELHVPESEKSNSNRTQKDKRNLEIFNAVIGILTLAAVVGYTVTAVRQWDEMSKQSALMREQANRDVIKYAGELAGLHQQAASAASAAKNANDTLNTMRAQFRLDQRPRIVIHPPEVTPDFATIGKPLAANVMFLNIGKSTAYNAIFHCHIVFGNNTSKIRYEGTKERNSGIDVEPTRPERVPAISMKDPYAREEAFFPPEERLPFDGEKPIIVFGRIRYEDQTGTKYCRPFIYGYVTQGIWEPITYFEIRDIHRSIRASSLCPPHDQR